MKIVITAQGTDLQAALDPRFGRALHFILFDTETENYEVLSNTSADTMHGAGIQTAQSIISKGVQAVITGQVGPNAHHALSAAGIKIYHSDDSTVKQAIEKFKNDELEQIKQSGPAHSGMGKPTK